MLERIKDFIKRHKKILLIILALLLIIFMIFFSRKTPNVSTEPVVQEKLTPGEDLISKGTVKASNLTDREKQSADISTTARTFTELYGTYSNQSNFLNIESVLPLLSAKYRSEMQNFLNKSRATYIQGEVYQGVTTSVLNVKVDSLDVNAGTGVVVVKTQRQESEGDRSNYTLKYQDIRITLIKFNNNWLVDNAEWL